MNRRSGPWMAMLMTVVTLAASLEAFAVPPRRLARRGVVVAQDPPSNAVVVPVPGAAPVAVGPALRPRRRMLVQPGMLAVPVTPGTTAAAPQALVARAAASPAQVSPPPAASRAARTASPAMDAKGASPVATDKTPAAAPEPIPAPRPTTAAAAMVAFTPAWYVEHPEAWRPAPATDVWKSADEATLTAWLGQPVAAVGAPADAVGAVETVGRTADVGADGLRSVLVLPAGHQNGVGPADADWLPLGVFAVVPPGTPRSSQADAVRRADALQQLSVDRQGTIKGTYYDAMSGAMQPIHGSIDRGTLTASWTVGANGSRFTAPMRSFVGQPRSVAMSIGGQQREMELAPAQPR